MLKHTPVLSLVLQIAAMEASDAQYELIEPEHLFIALCKLDGFANVNRLRALGVPNSQVGLIEAEIDLLMGLFRRFGINPVTFRHELRQFKGLGPLPGAVDDDDIMVHRSPESRKVFDEADVIAGEVNVSMVAIFHLLAGLLRNPQSSLATWLQGKRVDVVELATEAKSTVMPDPNLEAPKIVVHRSKESDFLNRYGIDLKELVQQKSVNAYSDLDESVNQIIKALNKPGKNNALLLMEESQDGKKVIEQFAWQIVHGEAPQKIKKRQIIQMNLPALANGINYQGEFAERVQTFIKTLLTDDDYILVVDNIHTIIGSGSLRGEMSKTAQMFRDILVQGRLQCVGATVPGEYYEYIGRDLNLRELFQPISISAQVQVRPADTAKLQTETLTLEPSQPVSTYGTISLQPDETQTDKRPDQTIQPAQNQDAIDQAIDQLESRLWRFGLRLQVTQSALALLARLAGRGTTSIDEQIDLYIEKPLGSMLFRGEISEGQKAIVSAAGNEFAIRVS